jgi:DNA-directed RNA polymerase specialized sigma24 family protein
MILANRQDSEDAVQQVFTRLLRSPSAIRAEAIEHYLRTAVRNECFSLLRSRQRAPDESHDALLEAVSADSDPVERIALEAALRTLAGRTTRSRPFEGL